MHSVLLRHAVRLLRVHALRLRIAGLTGMPRRAGRALHAGLLRPGGLLALHVDDHAADQAGEHEDHGDRDARTTTAAAVCTAAACGVIGLLLRLVTLALLLERACLLQHARRLGVRGEQREHFLEVDDRFVEIAGPQLVEALLPDPRGLRRFGVDLRVGEELVHGRRRDDEVEALDLAAAAEGGEADDLAVVVDRWAAGVAVGDRGADLDDRLSGAGALDRGDGAFVDRGLELRLVVEQALHVGGARVADREDLVLDQDLVGVGDDEVRRVLRVDLDDRDIGALAGLAVRLDGVGELRAIGEHDRGVRHDGGAFLQRAHEFDLGLLAHLRELFRVLLLDLRGQRLERLGFRVLLALLDVLDDVGVCHDVAIGADEEAGSHAADVLLELIVAELERDLPEAEDAHDRALREDRCALVRARAVVGAGRRGGERKQQRGCAQHGPPSEHTV